MRLHGAVEDWWEVAGRTLPYANYWHVKNYTRDEDARHRGVVTSPRTWRWDSSTTARRRSAGSACFQGVICTEHYGGDGLSISAANREYLRTRILPRPRVRLPGASRRSDSSFRTLKEPVR